MRRPFLLLRTTAPRGWWRTANTSLAPDKLVFFSDGSLLSLAACVEGSDEGIEHGLFKD